MGWARGNLDDMEQQLRALVHAGFLRETPAEALANYPRYLKAMILRTERAKRDPARDQARMLELKPFVDALDQAAARGLQQRDEWQSLRWDLEELRVSVFAQEPGCQIGRVGEEAVAAGGRVAQLTGDRGAGDDGLPPSPALGRSLVLPPTGY